MKLALAAPGYGSVYRGAENVIHELSKHFVLNGLNGHILCGFLPSSCLRGKVPGVKVHEFPLVKRQYLPQRPYPLGEISGWCEALSFSFSSFLHVLRENYDILLLIQFLSVHHGLIVKKIRGTKIVYSLQCDPSPKMKPLLLSLKYVDKVVSISRFVRQRLKEVHGIESVLIHNGVDTRRFSPNLDGSIIRAKLGMSPITENVDETLITFVGALLGKKGVYTLLRAFAQLPNSCFLMIVGSGPEYQRLRKVASDLKVLNRVFLVGLVPNELLQDYYAASDIVVVPSEYNEALGIVVLEAMSSGKAVVVSNVGGIPELVRNYGTGLVFKAGDHVDLARKLRLLFLQPSLRRKLGNNARKYAVEHFDWSKISQQYLDLFEELVY